jgi:hypothetical protein
MVAKQPSIPTKFSALQYRGVVFDTKPCSDKLRKALYGLKQAHRAWCGRLRGFLFERGFEMGKVDQTLFLLR